MKCTKIVLTNRNELTQSNKHQGLKKDQTTRWFTTGYHGYSYKLSARTQEFLTPRESIEPQLTITTLMFPEDSAFNTGSSMDRWSKKTPRLTSAKRKNHTPRQNMLDDEYDFSYAISELLVDDTTRQITLEGTNEAEREDVALDFDEYYVSSDIEELIVNSQKTNEDTSEKNGHTKKEKNRRRDNNAKSEVTAKKKRNKFKKTIRFSFSKPPSPETEQVIRVDVTSNVSFEEMSQFEHIMSNNNLLKNDCSRGHSKIINAKMKDLSAGKFDNNNNEKDGDLGNEGVEEDFIVKCRQLALTQKKR